MGSIVNNPRLTDRWGVFVDRDAAGEACADLLASHPELLDGAICGGIPSGGVTIAGHIVRRFDLPFTLLVARKVQIPGNPESGMGAVAWDGRVYLDRPLIAALGIAPAQVEAAIRQARASVAKRLARFFGGMRMPVLRGRRVIVADDGLAGGSTVLAAVEALQAEGAGWIVVVVPTGHDRTVARVAALVDAVVCPNIRTGDRFAVAEAYRCWRDLGLDDVIALIRQLEDEGRF
jgi:predicted phosphoribosyltransferase